jgi:glucose-1-phosphate thymidylyltransferase
MKGIVLAGGAGTRLWPITRALSKQLLPIYDKPLVHYPIATLMTAGIREILIISTPEHLGLYSELLGDGTKLGIKFSYVVQPKPQGLAQALIVAETWLAGSSVALILGDNIFHGSGLGRNLSRFTDVVGAQIFAYQVSDPERYGVVTFDERGKVTSLTEKPRNPKSDYAIPGLYFYDSTAVQLAKSLEYSQRGELEITALNNAYLRQGRLQVEVLPRGTAWLDTGTFESMNDASNYIRIIEERQGKKVSCLEEIALEMGFIDKSQLEAIISEFSTSPYGLYLAKLLKTNE